ncbi:MAG: hypothetical protein ACFFCS_02265 [Candidatus Hodarchaeota archaeon]
MASIINGEIIPVSSMSIAIDISGPGKVELHFPLEIKNSTRDC